MNTAVREAIVGKVVTLADGMRGKCFCQLENGEYLLATGKGGQISHSFFDKDVVSVDKCHARRKAV